MSNFQISYDDVNLTAAKLRSGQHDIDSQLTTLKGHVDTLLSAGFRSDKGSVAFGEFYTDFTKKATDFMESLDNLALFLEGVRDSTQEYDAKLAGAFTASAGTN